MNTIHANGIQLCYDILGEENQKTMVLISGLGTQFIRWTVPFCNLLVEKGYKVIRFDNRDSGESSYIATNDPISMNDLMTGNIKEVPYTLFDMAKDVIALLDALHIEKAHVVGRSMGGMIAQLVASEYPDRVLSLTSIMSSSLNPDLPQTKPEIMALMAGPKPDPATDHAGFIKQSLLFAKTISGSRYSFDEKEATSIIEQEYKRSGGKSGLIRQILAIAATGYSKERLAKIKTPTLVIHGTEDPIFLPKCGKDTAQSIKDAKLMLIEGMGHEIPAELYQTVVDAIDQTASR